jgi:hypothetical protein
MLATEIIQLDRIMRALGPEAEDGRRHLLKYIQLALNDADPLEENRDAEASLDAVGASLRAIRFQIGKSSHFGSMGAEFIGESSGSAGS